MKNINVNLDLSSHYTIFNTPSGSEPLLVEKVIKKLNRSAIVIMSDREALQRFVDVSDFFCPNLKIEVLPAWDCLPYDRLFPNPQVIANRVKVLTSLANELDRVDVLLLSVKSAMQLIPPVEYFNNRYLEVKVGEKISTKNLIKQISDYGFVNTPTVSEPGEFSVRGGIIDIFLSSEKKPVRIDFFGDLIDGIKYFDVETQISSKPINKIFIFSLLEFSLDQESISTFRNNYRAKFGGISKDDFLYHSVSEGQYVQGLEHSLPLFYESLASIFEACPDRVVFHESGIKNQLFDYERLIKAQFELRLDEAKVNGTGHGSSKLVPSCSMFMNSDTVRELSLERGLFSFHEYNLPPNDFSLDSGFRNSHNFSRERKDLSSSIFVAMRDYISKKIQPNKKIFFLTYSQKSAERLLLLFKEAGVNNALVLDSFEDARSVNASVFVGICAIENGFYSDDFYLITEQDVFGERIVRKAKAKKNKLNGVLRHAAEITVGELVVHLDHGVGKYMGLEVIEAAKSKHECLVIEYYGKDRLMLPITNIELLSKYGSENAVLDKLGTASWQARKAKLAEKINELAEKLIDIAAKRALNKAAVMPVPSTEWHEFCAAFPFQETIDQENAINDVISDFQTGKPTDRLICGDVGFGKTEIALRAAFIAVKNLKQVAVIAPTTILSSQHFKSFLLRFKKTEFKIGLLSRLASKRDMATIKAGLKTGEINIVIGTQAVLGKSITFLDLGLVIIDEEQQFGVLDKEKLKNLGESIHVLSLTATPIPRTLQQAFTGLRSMSMIMTPPIDRVTTQTYNIEFDKIIIREALLREKNRGGQSFFIVPRISDISEIQIYLESFVPELNFVVAHGKMKSSILENNMNGFYMGQFDVLLATTIAQSGLDIPSANTILIYNADYLGLAQLYQLRGRVGRSKIRSHAYFIVSSREEISEAAKKRLKVMSSLTDLGSGFLLASQDLDMRGAGNLLGDEQSGHIKEVGFELYQQMLKNRIDDLTSGNKGLKAMEPWSPQINLNISALIPEGYVKDLGIRLSLYQRLASVEDFGDYNNLLEEMNDRFGAIPIEVLKLVDLMKIKNMCKIAKIEKLDASKNGASLTFIDDKFANPEGLVNLIQRNSRLLSVRRGKLIINSDWKAERNRIKGVKLFLKKLVDILQKKTPSEEGASY